MNFISNLDARMLERYVVSKEAIRMILLTFIMIRVMRYIESGRWRKAKGVEKVSINLSIAYISFTMLVIIGRGNDILG